MTGWLAFAVLAPAMVLAMTAGWAWQRRHGNAGIVDVLWSLGMGLGALLAAAFGTGAAAPRIAVAALGAAWACRLGWHLWRRVSGEPTEDGRYRELREHWHGDQRRFYAMFMAQAVAVLLFSLPFVAAAANPSSFPLPLLLGLAIWLVAVGGEALADRQLARFRADPLHRGRTCRDGLWRHSRHPNYFFEWVHWFAYVALAWGSPLWWLAWAGPVVMYVFLRWISGIPYTERQALRHRGDDYRDYQRRTPMLIPWFPKTSSSTRQTR